MSFTVQTTIIVNNKTFSVTHTEFCREIWFSALRNYFRGFLYETINSLSMSLFSFCILPQNLVNEICTTFDLRYELSEQHTFCHEYIYTLSGEKENILIAMYWLILLRRFPDLFDDTYKDFSAFLRNIPKAEIYGNKMRSIKEWRLNKAGDFPKTGVMVLTGTPPLWSRENAI